MHHPLPVPLLLVLLALRRLMLSPLSSAPFKLWAQSALPDLVYLIPSARSLLPHLHQPMLLRSMANLTNSVHESY